MLFGLLFVVQHAYVKKGKGKKCEPEKAREKKPHRTENNTKDRNHQLSVLKVIVFVQKAKINGQNWVTQHHN